MVNLVDNLRGKSLAEWMAEWCTWLHSSYVEYRASALEPLFARAVHEYITDDLGHRVQKNTEYIRDEDQNGRPILPITTDTPIYVEVASAYYFIGETYQGYTLNTIEDCKAYCRSDTQISRNMRPKAKIKKEGAQEEQIPLTLVETEVIIYVPLQSELAANFRVPVTPGSTIHGYVVGLIALIEKLDAGTYRLEFEAKGPDYQTKSKYKLEVA
jgi:hypothetical protein